MTLISGKCYYILIAAILKYHFKNQSYLHSYTSIGVIIIYITCLYMSHGLVWRKIIPMFLSKSLVYLRVISCIHHMATVQSQTPSKNCLCHLRISDFEKFRCFFLFPPSIVPYLSVFYPSRHRTCGQSTVFFCGVFKTCSSRNFF